VQSALRILAVRLSALGDLILAQAALHALRSQLPNAEITWVIDEKFRGIAEAVPGVRAVGIRKPKSPVDYLSVWRAFSGEKFDALLAMQANFRVNLLYAGLRATRRIGFDPRRARDGHRWFVRETIQRRDEHLLDGFFQFVEAVGANRPDEPQWPAALVASAEAWWRELNLRGPYVVVHTGTSKPERCWPSYRYGELAARFSSNQGLPVVLTGGNSAHEKAAAGAFKTECPRALDLTGTTNLDQLRTTLKYASAVVTPDTAAVHLARAEGVPVVGLYAVARAELSGPYRALNYTLDRYPEAVRMLAKRDPATVDWHFRVHHPDAMRLIEAPEVWRQIERALLDRARSI
jgi:heptosyltransferase I